MAVPANVYGAWQRQQAAAEQDRLRRELLRARIAEALAAMRMT